ncbi:MAG: TetR/AcrR family transcriptional regulator [Desulfobacterales bacterium]|jgi:AcrR family transcriptional regulator|nr:TetR/AcrR family transcriptional regulator [Desulfobacterales bacterium]
METIGTNPKLTRTERRKTLNRQQIIRATFEAFAELGYVKTTVDDITTRADLGHGTFYKYFKNKQDLLSMLADNVAKKMGYHYPKDKPLSVYERIRYGVKSVLRLYLQHRGIILALQEAMIYDKQFEEKWLKIHEGLFKISTRNMKASIEKGYCRNIDMELTNAAVTAIMEGYANYIMKQAHDSVDLDTHADYLSDVIYHAFFKVDPQQELLKNFNSERVLASDRVPANNLP